MHKIKSLLLGSAAGLMAATGAQAADLPIVAAEPVDYVRVCDAYGSGFFYIPGTETCLKIGGYVRMDLSFHDDNIFDNDRYGGDPLAVGLPGSENTNSTNWRARGYVTFDARTETELGLLRSFIAFEGNANNAGSGDDFILEKGFIQFAGLTAGLAPSVLNFETVGTIHEHAADPNDDWIQLSYTADFGGGFSATVGIEDQNASNGIGLFGSDLPGVEAGFYGGGVNDPVPNLVANITVSQGWGSAMLGGVIGYNQVRTTYSDGVDFFDEEDDELGYAVVGGVEVEFLERSSAVLRGAWGEGMHEYVMRYETEEVSFGFVDDPADPFTPGVDDPYDYFGYSQNEAWSVYGGVRHYFTDRLRSSVAASYVSSDVAVFGGDVEVDQLEVTANVIYSPVQNLDIGLEAVYANVDVDGLGGTPAAGPERDEDGFGAIFRVQRSF